jgi:hypothetical protein
VTHARGIASQACPPPLPVQDPGVPIHAHGRREIRRLPNQSQKTSARRRPLADNMSPATRYRWNLGQATTSDEVSCYLFNVSRYAHRRRALKMHSRHRDNRRKQLLSYLFDAKHRELIRLLGAGANRSAVLLRHQIAPSIICIK